MTCAPPGLLVVHYVHAHESDDDGMTISVGLTVNLPVEKMIDGLPAPECPIPDCTERMELTDHEGYVELMGDGHVD